MTLDQVCALGVLVAVVAAMIHGRVRADVVALAGAATLMALGVVRPVEAQGAFASPAILALASLFVIAYAMELSGLLDWLVHRALRLSQALGSTGVWITLGLCGAVSAFLNNTPIVVLGAPVIQRMARSLKQSPKRYLIPLSYMTVLGGTCTLIGTSTNLLVNDMARNAGQPAFGIFEITPAAVCVALAGGVYLLLAAPRLLKGLPDEPAPTASGDLAETADYVGDPEVFADTRPLDVRRGLAALGVFVAAVAAAALGWAPIAATAFTGAVVLVLFRVITADEAYRGLRPEVLLLVAGMIVIGLALEVSGLAESATNAATALVGGLSPLLALILLYGATLFLTELLSNATVAVLLTPVAVALAESLGVSPRPFLVAVMISGSAAFATPFGYQTNVIVYQMGRYAYLDFVRIGLPLNLITWAVAVLVIPRWFPF